MRQWGGHSGFTVVEVMLFLAISTAMFISVVILFGGVQQRNQFNQSMRDIDSKFQDVINDVSSGYFDELKNYQCVAGNSSHPTFVAGGSGQGTNQGCIFLGKAVLLAPGGKAELMEVSPVVGNRLDAVNKKDVTSYSGAFPTTVYGGSVDLTTVYDIRWGMRVKSATVAGATRYAGGFYGTLPSYTSGSVLQSGAQRVFRFSHNLPPDQNRGALQNCVQSSACFGLLPATDPWIICFERADGRETARLSVGGNDTLTTKLEFINC